MKTNKMLLFVVTTFTAFLSFGAIAYGIERSGVVDMLGRASMMSEIDQHEQSWQALNVDSYRIEVIKFNSIWHAQTYTITVRDNQVVEQSTSCIPAPIEGRDCEAWEYEAADYIVAGLFASAQDLAQRRAEHTAITYDATYHFPATIRYDDAQIYDDDNFWRVVSFEVLE